MTLSLSGDTFVVGDLNVHFDNPVHPTISKLNDLLYMFDLTQSVSHPTQRCGHTLDIVIHKRGCSCVHSVRVTDGLESDHACIVTQLNVPCPPPPPPVYKVTRNIRDIDRLAFQSDL